MMLNVQNWRSDHCHMIFCWKWEKVCLISPPGTLPKLTEANRCWGLAQNSKLPQTQKDRLRSVLPPNVRLAKFKLFNKEVRLILNDVFEWSWVILSNVRWLLFLWLFSFRTRLRRNRVAPNAKVVLCASHSWKESERRTRRTVATL